MEETGRMEFMGQEFSSRGRAAAVAAAVAALWSLCTLKRADLEQLQPLVEQRETQGRAQQMELMERMETSMKLSSGRQQQLLK
jgi:hypothetical protein